MELSCSLTTLAASCTSGTVSSAACALSLFLSFSLSQARPGRDLQHITWRLRCCLLVVGHQQHLDFAASHRLGHLCFSWHVGSRCSLLHNFDLLLKLHQVEEVPGCPHFTWDIFLIELEMQILRLFSLRLTRSLCNSASVSDSKGCFMILLVTNPLQIRAFTILLLALIVLLRHCSS